MARTTWTVKKQESKTLTLDKSWADELRKLATENSFALSAFVWYFWSAREYVHIFPQYICELTICAVKMVRETLTKKIVV